MRIDFYHLTSAPLERVLPSICDKVVASGQRLLIVAASDRLPALDRELWTYAPEAFLPHGVAGGPRDADQPVLLSAETEAANGARNIAIADGEWRDAALSFDRAFFFFDAATIDNARTSWRALKDRHGAERHYWKQDEDGRWVEGP